jgi:signal transduction histidine kinase
LSFVAWIVESHGGRIDVASNDGASNDIAGKAKGTRFTVLLPVAAESQEYDAVESAKLTS